MISHHTFIKYSYSTKECSNKSVIKNGQENKHLVFYVTALNVKIQNNCAEGKSKF